MYTTAALVLAAALPAFADHQPLSKWETASGWRLLDSQSHFRGYKQPGFPAKGWTLDDGELKLPAKAEAGDVITTDQFGDFEMELEFKLAPKSNSGLIYRVTEKHGATWQTGPEFQLFDDAGNNTKPTDMHSCGALYDLYAPAEGKTVKPAGEWNTARVRIYDGVVQHFLNGFKVVDTRIDGPEWKAKIAGSKFKDYEGFGVLPRGHVALQDHGDAVAFRHIRVRNLDTPMPGEIKLFNGKDMAGWVAVVPELTAKKEDPAAVWTVADGVLVCKGNPAGYIRTDKDYKNFILRLQWRWPEGKPAGNSGVLFRKIGDDKVWPKSIEAQLHSGNAGDFWLIEEYPMKAIAERTKGRNVKKTHGAERPVGQWNDYEIIVNKGDVIVRVNGEELNRGWEAQEVAGAICLQSEGAEIHFRHIRLIPLD
jgi:hypothetical protein